MQIGDNLGFLLGLNDELRQYSLNNVIYDL